MGCRPEEVRQGSNYALRHALACTVNCVLLAITHAYKYSWLLDFLAILPGAQRGSAAQKVYFGIGEPLARSTVDALNEGRKCCLPIYNSH